MHVATNFFDVTTNKTIVNHNMFLNTIGKYPDRLRNLYFLYAAILRAIKRAEPILRAFDFETKIN